MQFDIATPIETNTALANIGLVEVVDLNQSPKANTNKVQRSLQLVK